MPTLLTISRALASPMPWMYCSATTTRLLVGMLTPAIRATWNLLLDHAREARTAPRPSTPVGVGRRVLRALSRKRPVIWIGDAASMAETPKCERNTARARGDPPSRGALGLGQGR